MRFEAPSGEKVDDALVRWLDNPPDTEKLGELLVNEDENADGESWEDIEAQMRQLERKCHRRSEEEEDADDTVADDDDDLECAACGETSEGAHMMLCDSCDTACHTHCCRPRFHTVPEGDWHCDECKSQATEADEGGRQQESTRRRRREMRPMSGLPRRAGGRRRVARRRRPKRRRSRRRRRRRR